MVDRTLISQLQSLNAGQRRAAIMALGRTKDRDAIPHLTRVAETDPDDELRELARKASIYIDKHTPPVNVKPFKIWDDEDEEEAEPEPEPEPAPAPVPPPLAAAPAPILTDYEYQPLTPEQEAEQKDREWAERFIERAWQAYYTGDKEGAELNMRKAFERAPSIVDTDIARDAASKIMGMNPDRAIAALLKPKTMRRGITGTIGSKPITAARTTMTTKATKANGMPGAGEKTIDEIEDGSLGTLVLDLFIYFVITFIINLVLILLIQNFFADRVVAANLAANDYPAAYSREVLLLVNQGGTVGIAAYSALSALSDVVLGVLLWFIIHVVATMLLGGNSTFPRLVRKTYLYFALLTPVLIVLMVVAVFLAAILREAAILQTALAVAILGTIFVSAWRIGVAYRFDIARGCFTLILTSIALVCCGATVTIALIATRVGPFAAIADQLARR